MLSTCVSYYRYVFTARCTTVQSEVLRSHVVCLSVGPSVCDVGGSRVRTTYVGNLGIIARTISPTFSFFVAQGEHGEIFRRLEVGWGKAAMSLKCLKIEEKLLWMAYSKSPTRFRTVPFPTPTPHPFVDWKFSTSSPTQKKLQSLLSLEGVKLGTSNLASTFKGSISKNIKNWRKGNVDVSRDCPNFGGTPII